MTGDAPAPAAGGGRGPAEVRAALAAGELVLRYQPQYASRTGLVEAAEALVRWVQPGGALLPPGAFLPGLRGSEVLEELTAWAVDQSARQLRRWRACGLDLAVAVNVAPETLARADVVAMVDDACHRADVAPAGLVVEITEEALPEDGGRIRPQLDELRRRGVRVALDDFGVGGASLARLRDLPVDQLKLDGRFVGRCAVDPADLAVVRTVRDLAGLLDVQTVAECVEDEATRRLLSELGYDLLQGHGLCRPVEPEAVAGLGPQGIPAQRTGTTPVGAAGTPGQVEMASAEPAASPAGDPAERRALAEAILCDAVGPAYADLAIVAAELAECPLARLSLLTEVEAVIGAVGEPGEARLLETSPVSLALSSPAGLCQVRDLWADPRTRGLPEAQGESPVRFLAVAALRWPAGGQVVGALSVLDHRPRVLSAAQRRGLERLAVVATDRLVLGTRAGALAGWDGVRKPAATAAAPESVLLDRLRLSP